MKLGYGHERILLYNSCIFINCHCILVQHNRDVLYTKGNKKKKKTYENRV